MAFTNERDSGKPTGLYCSMAMMDLQLPLDYSAIERILPHRYPFLLVDRITEFEPDKRIVGIKNVSANEHYLSRHRARPRRCRRRSSPRRWRRWAPS